MIGSTSSLVLKRLLPLLLLIVSRLIAAHNEVSWNYIDLPATGTAGDTIRFEASVTNQGDAWDGSYYIELRDRQGVHLNYAMLAGTPVGGSRRAAFELKLPATPGTYTYQFTALQHETEYFGFTQLRSIVVREPLEVSLVVDNVAIVVGDRVKLRSDVGPDGDVVAHGVEARAHGGAWLVWAEWNDHGREPQVAISSPEKPGVYELRAYASRSGEEPTYSSRATLIVNAIPPTITTPPSDAMAGVGETVSLSVVATGTAPTFQWRKDGVDLVGATDSTLTLSPTQVGHSGSYTVAVANATGAVTSRAANVTISPRSLAPVIAEVWNFPAGGAKRAVAITSAHVGDVVSLQSTANITAGAGWRHNVLVRRPAIAAADAMAPEDGSGLGAAGEAWNKDSWGNPHVDGNSYDPKVTGQVAPDLGNREPFIHPLADGQAGSTRAFDFVLDAPGQWLVRAEIVDGTGQTVAVSVTTTLTVENAPMAGEVANISYPYGRDDKFVGVFWNAGQAHRLWSTWRALFQAAYPATWAVNWKLMWQPSPYFIGFDGTGLRTTPPADSPWQPFWSAHQVYALVPDGAGRSRLTHDITSRDFAEKAAVRLMDIGVDFVAVDYTNQFLEEREDVFPAVNNLAQAFAAVAARSQSGQRIKLCAVVPGNVTSGDWGGNGGFVPAAIARFNAKLTTLYTRFARFESAWFHLEDDNGVRKPLLLLWVGASGEGEPDGKLSSAVLNRLKLADGRLLAEVFTIRWVGAFLPANRRFLTGGSYSVATTNGIVTGKYANAKMWSYNERHPSAASVMVGAGGATPTVEAITVQPFASGEDRFGRAWTENWPPGQGFHYETPVTTEPVPLSGYGRTWAEALAVARALNPKFLLTTWAEFGSENDEPRPELSVTIMDNNKFGTHFGDAFKQAVRLFKYRAPTGWLDTFTTGGRTYSFTEVSAPSLVLLRDQQVQLQGWVNPNVATSFAGGRVKIFIDDQFKGAATVGGTWNGATRWTFDLSAATLDAGRHTLKILFDDAVGGTSLAGVRFRDQAPSSVLAVEVF